MNWREWRWVKRLGHWLTIDCTDHTFIVDHVISGSKRVLCFTEVERLVRRARRIKGTSSGEEKRAWVKHGITAVHDQQGTLQPESRDVNLVIEIIVQGL